VCGSLQSWPPVDPGENGFFIPDTFAHDSRCFPKFIEPLQAFNLSQVRANGRVVDSKSTFGGGLGGLLRALPRLGIRLRTFVRIALQLVSERFDRTRASRRPIFQTVLFWDVFRKLFDPRNPPAFSTFFTNHVASSMHRYWHEAFPEDFGDKYRGQPQRYLNTLLFSLDVLDEMLEQAVRYAKVNPRLRIVLASSMGQDAVHYESHEGWELAVSNVARLMHACGVEEGAYKPLLAMVPQVAVELGDDVRLRTLKETLEGARTASGQPLFRTESFGNSLSITVVTPRLTDIQAGTCEIAGVTKKLDDCGVRAHEVEPGTGYHIPEGILMVYTPDEAQDSRSPMKSTEAKAFLQELAGLA
jgi:hypothetical protein